MIPDVSVVDEVGAWATLDYINVTSLADTFYLYYGTWMSENVGSALRIAQYDENKMSLSDSFVFYSGLKSNGQTHIEIDKIEGCKYVRIFSSGGPTVCKLVSELPNE